ncbi:MAG: CDP-alcohol phosphatidyltransferase family protein [Arenicellales bacterium WSBS_2016_MAG_OTU3]
MPARPKNPPILLSQIPNLLSMLRIVATPVIVLLLYERSYESALILFLAAGVTDGLDGFIAKRFNFVTKLGAMLDPLADKMMLVSALVMLTIIGDIPFWLLIFVVFRDVLIIGGYLMLESLEEDDQMSPTPSYVSKLNTFLQISLVVGILIEKAQWFEFGIAIDLLISAALLTTIVSGMHYLWIWGVRLDSATQKKQKQKQQGN